MIHSDVRITWDICGTIKQLWVCSCMTGFQVDPWLTYDSKWLAMIKVQHLFVRTNYICLALGLAKISHCFVVFIGEENDVCVYVCVAVWSSSPQAMAFAPVVAVFVVMDGLESTASSPVAAAWLTNRAKACVRQPTASCALEKVRPSSPSAALYLWQKRWERSTMALHFTCHGAMEVQQS